MSIFGIKDTQEHQAQISNVWSKANCCCCVSAARACLPKLSLLRYDRCDWHQAWLRSLQGWKSMFPQCSSHSSRAAAAVACKTCCVVGYPRVKQLWCIFMEKERSSDTGLPWGKNLQELRKSFVWIKAELRCQDLTLFVPFPLLGRFQMHCRFCWKTPRKFLLSLPATQEFPLQETQSLITAISLHNSPKRTWHLTQVLLF